MHVRKYNHSFIYGRTMIKHILTTVLIHTMHAQA